jgi:hypothetical protein
MGSTRLTSKDDNQARRRLGNDKTREGDTAMAKFSSENQPKGRGRPKGSKNRRVTVNEELAQKTLERLTQAVDCGEAWAVQAVLDRVAPKLKAITPEQSLDGELIQARILEIRDLEQRLLALEARDIN